MPPLGDPTSAPYGVGTLAAAPEPPAGLADLSRWVSPGSGSAEVDAASGHLATMPSVRQRMLLLLRTRRGSVVGLPEFGVDLPTKIDEQFPRRVEASIRASAVQMTDVEKVARIDSVKVTSTALGRALVTVSFTDLTTHELSQLSVQV